MQTLQYQTNPGAQAGLAVTVTEQTLTQSPIDERVGSMVSNTVTIPKNMLIELEETFHNDGYLKQQKPKVQKPIVQPDFLTAD